MLSTTYSTELCELCWSNKGDILVGIYPNSGSAEKVKGAVVELVQLLEPMEF